MTGPIVGELIPREEYNDNGGVSMKERYITLEELKNSELRQQMIMKDMERTADRMAANIDLQFERFNSTTSNINTKIDGMDKKLNWLFSVLSGVVIGPIIIWAIGHFLLHK